LWRGGTDAQRLQIASKNSCYRRSVASVYFSLICQNEEIFWKLIIIICDVIYLPMLTAVLKTRRYEKSVHSI
ncbi:unnamed protein product, partial [Tenebrio molitor]